MSDDWQTETVSAYYDSLDAKQYGRLSELLHPEFVHDRPDMTLEGKIYFLEFMQHKRPVMETTHPIETVYSSPTGAVAAQGQLLDTDGNIITGFVDIFSFEGEQIRAIKTYTDR